MDSAEQLKKWQSDVEERQSTQYRRLLRAVLAAGLCLGIGLSWAMYASHVQGRHTADLAEQTAGLATLIQTQRADGYRTSCTDQNARHNRTIWQLKQTTHDPFAVNLATGLIDALAPVRDCTKLVEDRVGKKVP